MAKPSRDLTGRVIGRLTVIKRNGKAPAGNILWLCKCECGTKKTFYGSDLNQEKSRSCGCLNREMVTARATTHGGSKTRLYRTWYTMLLRCENKSHDKFADYGGRGITVCASWRDFETFRAWALQHGYAKNRTIDRENNDGNYEPGNCRWATMSQQILNRRVTKKNSLGIPWSTVADNNGIPRAIFSSRINDGGWPIEKAATHPVRRYKA